ncbi:retrotransposable element [Pimephales promelas]|nr:retrotransposable element [Pimephales promelas]
MVVPVLAVPGQTDDLILGSNAIKWLIQKMKETDGYWRLVSSPVNSEDVECHQFPSPLSNVERWKGEDMPDKVGTAKLKEKIVLEPHHEHLAWVQGTKTKRLWTFFTCIAAEELPTAESLKRNVQCAASSTSHVRTSDERRNLLDELGLRDLNLDACEVSGEWKDRLLNLTEKYESTFSRGKIEKPFRLPYRRVAPSHCDELRAALNEMEVQGIIRKSQSEYASPLVSVWKKNGDLRICTDFRCLNAKTAKDAHPLPHQADALAALGERKKYTAFSSPPFGLHECNRPPRGLTNSPATFMRRMMMMSIFGDENFTSLLCYLDDLMTDPEKVKVISDIQTTDLMEADGVTPSQKKIRSFPGMTLYQQRFVIDCSAKAKPLFKLPSDRSEKRTRSKCSRAEKPLGAVKLSPVDWTSERRTAFESLKRDLLHSVTLAHPDFGRDFILSVDASFDGIGAVLSQVPPGEKVARPVAFAGKTLSKSQLNCPARRLEFLALKLDACEQRRVAKLAAFDFDLKYVPGTKNIVADALSREPFVKSRVSRRLLREPCVSLLDEVNGVVTGTVQDAFRVTNNRRNVEATGNGTENELEDDANDSCPGSVDAAEVSAVLGAHCDGGVSPLPVTSPTSLQLPDEDASVAIPFSRLSNLQELDNVVGRVLHYVGRRKRPSKSEKVKEPSSVTALLKQWKKLKVRNHVPCGVKRGID